MSSASTLLTLFSHSQTDVVKDRDTASSFSRSSNCIFWCDACGKQSSALFSTSEIYHWADIDLMEESPEGNTIKLDFNWKCRKKLLLLKSHHNQWRHFLNTMGGNPLLPFSPVSGHRSLFSSCMFLPPSDTSLLLSAPGYAGRAHRALAPIVKVQKVLCQGAPGTPVPSRPCPSRALPLKKKGLLGASSDIYHKHQGLRGKLVRKCSFHGPFLIFLPWEGMVWGSDTAGIWIIQPCFGDWAVSVSN